MAYIGKQPEFTQYPSKFFDGDGTAMTVTLDYAPPNDAALLVFISGVRQDTSAYNCTGTSCTFTGAVPSGTANVQVVHMGLTVDVGVPGDDTVTAAKIATNAVGSSELADDAVDTAAIANNAVTGTKIAMVGDTQGDVLYYDGSNYARLGFGTSGDFLKTQGTGANPVWATVDSLPTQTSNANKVLVTDGSSATWEYAKPVNMAGAGSTDTLNDLVATSIFKKRNKMYNGAFNVWQRATTASVTGSGNTYYTADRWKTGHNVGVYTQSRQQGPLKYGHNKALQMDCTTAEGSPSADAYVWVEQNFEGFDLQDLKAGSGWAGGTPAIFVLSFWVKASLTGTYVLQNLASSTSICSATYTISVADTWEKKVIAFPGDDQGGFADDTSWNWGVRFWLVAGSNYTSASLQTTWANVGGTTTGYAAGQTNFASSTSNTWNIAGVQWELGDTATPFEFYKYSDMLTSCERYYQTYAMGFHAFGISGSIIDAQFSFRKQMRVSPSVTLLDTTPTFQAINVANYTGSSSSITTSAQAADGTGLVRVDGFSGVAANRVIFGNQTTPILGFDAEL